MSRDEGETLRKTLQEGIVPEGGGVLLDPLTWLTLGLMIFAGVQVWIPHRAEEARSLERAADERLRQAADDRELDLAYQTIWAEHFRLEALAESCRKGDLVQMSIFGVLRPEDVLPKDWSTQTRMLARLGVEAGYLGGVAITLSHDLAREIHEFNQSLADQFARDDDRAIGLRVQTVRQRIGGSRLAMYEDRIRTGLRQLSLLIWDAALHSPRGDVSRMLTFRHDLASKVARDTAAALAARGTPPPFSARGDPQ